MKKRIAALMLAALLLLSGCQTASAPKDADVGFRVEDMNRALLEAAGTLPRSQSLYFDNGLEITGLGVTYDGRPTAFDGCYYFPAIERMTGAHLAIDWQKSEGYASTVATTLLSGRRLCLISSTRRISA